MPNAVSLAVVAALAISCSSDPQETAPTPTTSPTTTTKLDVELTPKVVVHQRPGLDDVLLLGAPFGVEDRGTLVTVDLASGAVAGETHGGELWPPGFKDPTTDPEHPDAEAAARSPDGTLLAVFERGDGTRLTGVRVQDESAAGGEGGERFHHLQSVYDVVGDRLAWAPDGDAVYLIAAGRDGVADRVIGIPRSGSPQTVVRLDERGFTWLAVE